MGMWRGIGDAGVAIAWGLCLALCFPAVALPAKRDCGTAIATAEQLRATHVLADGWIVEELAASERDPLRLHPTLQDALALANRRFLAERPQLAADHVYRKQRDVEPAATTYFVLKRDGVVLGMGMALDAAVAPVPAQKEFPAAAQGENLVELARLAVDTTAKGGLQRIFAAMAAHLSRRYGAAEIPEALEVVLWTEVERLSEHYREKYGFEVRAGTVAPREPGKWLLAMSARAFVKRFAPRG